MLLTTTIVAFFKREQQSVPPASSSTTITTDKKTDDIYEEEEDDDDDNELDASQIGLKETYHRLWAVCQLPAVQWLFVILITYRLPTSLSDNVKFLKAVEFGMSKSTTALLSPMLILPLGILVPIVATKIWKPVKVGVAGDDDNYVSGEVANTTAKAKSSTEAASVAALKQFLHAYMARVTIVPILDVVMLKMIHNYVEAPDHDTTAVLLHWITIGLSTAAQAICNSLQFNAQMMFFASRVDPAIGGSYMTLLNTAANLGGTWPSSFIMWLISKLSAGGGASTTNGTPVGTGSDPYFSLQFILSILGVLWIVVLGPRVIQLSHLPDDAWRTHILDTATVSNDKDEEERFLLNNNGNNNINVDLQALLLISKRRLTEYQTH